MSDENIENLVISKTRTDSSSFRVKDGLLLDEIQELTINGGEHVPDEMTLDELASPEEAGGRDSISTAEIDSPCELTPSGKCKNPGKIAQCKHSSYKNPASAKVLRDILTASKGEVPEGGHIWKASIVPDNFDQNYERKKTLKMCHKNNYDAKNKCIKPRRGNLLVKSSDFFGSLVKIKKEDDELDDFFLYSTKSLWAFSGVLCGWPALTTLELVKIEFKRALSLQWKTHWDSEDNPRDEEPSFPGGPVLTEVRAVLRSPPSSMFGWSKSSPGFVFWFEGNGTRDVPRINIGTGILKQFKKDSMDERGGIMEPSPNCVKVHMISHRYAVGDNVQIRDRLTYHSFALLEWDHKKYCSVVELAYLGGVGGYVGKANWVEDKMEPVNSLYKCLPPEMIHPWKQNLSEIRVYDVKAKSLEEHLDFMTRHTGKDGRFLNVQCTVSLPVRLTFSSKENVAQYLINYIRRGKTYSEIRRNCQTFAADFCAFLSGKKDIQPFHPINQQAYRNQAHYFLYEASMYD
mmetsp:Transcript_11191/g.16800  ORF Transcript_11191/g.16800 Transcript_11191/m.16800 type:complete len:517 (+) Transcript_11191:94-1644(+)